MATYLAGRCFGAATPDALTVAEREGPLVRRIAEHTVARWAQRAIGAPPDRATIWMDELRLQDGVVRQVRYLVRALSSAAAFDRVREFLQLSLARSSAKLRAQATRSYDRLLSAWFTPAVGPSLAKAGLMLPIRRRARARAEAALARDPESPEAWCNLGDALSNLERYAEAVACYDKALALAPDARAEKRRTAAMEGVIRMGSSRRN